MPFITNSISYAISESVFPYELKRSQVIPLFKKEDPPKNESNPPVSLLPHISKILERLIYRQISNYMENKISTCGTAFQKSDGTKHSLITMLEKCKKSLDKGEFVSVIFMDRLKVFDTIIHDLLLANITGI